jgi:hypothetical protein
MIESIIMMDKNEFESFNNRIKYMLIKTIIDFKDQKSKIYKSNKKGLKKSKCKIK